MGFLNRFSSSRRRVLANLSRSNTPPSPHASGWMTTLLRSIKTSEVAAPRVVNESDAKPSSAQRLRIRPDTAHSALIETQASSSAVPYGSLGSEEAEPEYHAEIDQYSCELLAESCPKLDPWISRYVSQHPDRSHSHHSDELYRFINWLADSLNSDEREKLQFSEWRTNEGAALRQRLAHARFQQQLQQSPQPMGGNVYLNPIRVWATFKSRESELSNSLSHVLFYAVGQETRMQVLSCLPQSILRLLERGPLSIENLLMQAECEKETALQALQELASLKIIAISK